MTPETQWLLANGTVEPLEPFNADHLDSRNLPACGDFEPDALEEQKDTIDGVSSIVTFTYATCRCPEDLSVRAEYKGSVKDIERAVRREANAKRLLAL